MSRGPTVWFLSHPEVVVDPLVPITQWGLSDRGRARVIRLRGADFLTAATSVWSSCETKARETAHLLAPSGVPVLELEALGENDRSSTGFLPPDEFERVADEFFARPNESVRGWASAVEEQRRVVAALDTVLADERSGSGDVVVVAHGGVGTLLLCSLLGHPVTRDLDQPGQGHYLAFERDTRSVTERWRRLEDLV